jgi:hypothetical protein
LDDTLSSPSIAVIGLGYVGLPLALADAVEVREFFGMDRGPIWATTRAAQESIQWYKDVLGGKLAIDVGRQRIESFEKDCAQP